MSERDVWRDVAGRSRKTAGKLGGGLVTGGGAVVVELPPPPPQAVSRRMAKIIDEHF